MGRKVLGDNGLANNDLRGESSGCRESPLALVPWWPHGDFQRRGEPWDAPRPRGRSGGKCYPQITQISADGKNATRRRRGAEEDKGKGNANALVSPLLFSLRLRASASNRAFRSVESAESA